MTSPLLASWVNKPPFAKVPEGNQDGPTRKAHVMMKATKEKGGIMKEVLFFELSLRSNRYCVFLRIAAMI